MGAWILLVYAGYALGENFEQVGHYVGPVSDAVIAGIVVVYAWRVFRRKGCQARGSRKG